jgi:hypothetical protein
MYASFNCFKIKTTKKEAFSMSHQGECYYDIAALLPKFNRQLEKIGAEKIAAELKECGAWSEEELSDIEQNKMRILWIAAGNIIEERHCRGKN